MKLNRIDPEDWYTTQQAADLLGVTVACLYKWIHPRNGRPPIVKASKLGGRIRIQGKSLLETLRRLE
ncbi:helix-turn-helix domain-containing protein [Candidatus Darwinibacter acetoxidans]